MADQNTAELPEGTDTVIEARQRAIPTTGERSGADTSGDRAARPIACDASAAAASSLRARPANGRAVSSARDSNARPKRLPMFRKMVGDTAVRNR